jgi:calcineurin-like phosphoesterase family protein
MANTYVISDTHFNHAAILTFKDYAGEPPRAEFTDVEHMNEHMMDMWSQTVKPEDTIYHLGDVMFGTDKVDWMEKNFVKLPGKKHLILGNHDNPKHMLPFFKEILFWKHLPGMLLSHIPVHEQQLAESHRWGDGDILNVHGHIHSNPSPLGPYFCVSVEQVAYTPVNVDDVYDRYYGNLD